MSSTEGDKATRAARWQVLPQPRVSVRMRQHLPRGRQEEMLCPGYFQLLYSSLPEAALRQGDACTGQHPANPTLGGCGARSPAGTLHNYPLGDFSDAMAAVYATLSHCQLGC